MYTDLKERSQARVIHRWWGGLRRKAAGHGLYTGGYATVTTHFIQSVHYEHRTDSDNPDSCVSHRVTAMPEHHVEDVQCDHLDAL